MNSGQTEPVTIERLEQGLAQLAFYVTTFPNGDVYLPLFSKLETELQDKRRQEDTLDRARRMVANYTLEGGLKAIR